MLRSGICYRKSASLSSVTIVHPTQGVVTFGNISSPFCVFSHPLTSVQHFTDHPREPIHQGILDSQFKFRIMIMITKYVARRSQRMSPTYAPSPHLRYLLLCIDICSCVQSAGYRLALCWCTTVHRTVAFPLEKILVLSLIHISEPTRPY